MRGTPSTFMIHREPVFMQDPKYMVTDMIIIILLAVVISVCIYSFQVLFCGKYADHVGICNRGFLLRSSSKWLSSDLAISKDSQIHRLIGIVWKYCTIWKTSITTWAIMNENDPMFSECIDKKPKGTAPTFPPTKTVMVIRQHHHLSGSRR